VVGMGSVVVRDIPAGVVAAGNPCAGHPTALSAPEPMRAPRWRGESFWRRECVGSASLSRAGSCRAVQRL
jgi:hypothetical protein